MIRTAQEKAHSLCHLAYLSALKTTPEAKTEPEAWIRSRCSDASRSFEKPKSGRKGYEQLGG